MIDAIREAKRVAATLPPIAVEVGDVYSMAMRSRRDMYTVVRVTSTNVTIQHESASLKPLILTHERLSEYVRLGVITREGGL
jgi:hypothetical protein